MRIGDDAWPNDLPHLPWQVWVSTVALLATSVAFAEAVAASRRGSDTGIRLALATAAVMVVVFTGMQAWAWLDWYEQTPAIEAVTQEHRIGITGFWVFTTMHVAHVLGVYWHFLDIVWIVLLLTMIVVL